MNHLETLNHTLFLLLNANENTPAWLIRVAVVIANDLIYIIPLLLVALWLWGDDKLRHQAVKACLVVLLALGVNGLIGLGYPQPRPFVIGLGHLWTDHAPDFSFPSNHMTILTCIGLTLLFAGMLKLGVAILALGIAVAWARVFVGVHFPLDMLGALAAAAGVCAVTTALWPKIGDPIAQAAIRLYRFLFAWPIAAGWVRG
ncbi:MULTISPECIES: phosphatase PAP2 family protein [Chromobacterium]|uniref:Phosphatase PAP2 family protein n=1 Tax=Chromobacterium rhizoryzae TaxID=1778675 RepID=A0AAD0RQN2_9NEIS|nr:MULTISPECIES: phosphatase PAP2 family protein [Chromobacterium]AXT45964.1 phosphatase PAP2 family protein [Chromobacterium rhizoryzae]QOD84309.1 phosphatase PAP2 family protein [Chromobacterium haemolyticum]